MSHEATDGENEGGGFAIADAIAIVRRRWRMILATTIAVAILGVLAALAMPSRYEASATIQIDPRKKTIVNLENVIADMQADQASIESEVEVLRSKSLALKVIAALDLRNHPEFTRPSLPTRILRLIGLAREQPRLMQRAPDASPGLLATGDQPAGPDPQRDEVVSAFERKLKAQRVRNTLIIEVRFTAESPLLAAKVANLILELYLKDQLNAKVRATEQATGLIEKKLEGLRRKVYEAEQRVEAFKAANSIFDAEGQVLSEKQLARLMEQTVIARNQTAEAKARFDQIRRLLGEGRGSGSIADVLQSHTVRLFKDQLVKATRHEAELLTRYGPKHPEIEKARAEVADIEAQLAREVEKIVVNLETEYRVAQERERTLADGLGGAKEQQILSKEASVRLRELEREALTSRQLFEAFLQRYKQTAETQGLQVADSRIIERADVPLYPASPRRAQIAALGLVAGLVMGLGLAFLIDLTSSGLMRPEDVALSLGIPHLASVPLLKRRSDGLETPAAAARVSINLPTGIFAEAVRATRHAIDARRDDPGPRIILVTSALPNEGKTLLAANLAHQLAAAGVRTLIIDADLRRCSLTHQLGLEQAPGFIEAAGQAQPLDAYLLRDATSGLVVLPAGGIEGTGLAPDEALGLPGLGHRLHRLKGYFDTIIIDAPPVLPVVDARMLADHADQIVLVTTWRRTPRQLVKRAIQVLGTNAPKLVGAIINQVDPMEHARSVGYARTPGESRRLSDRGSARPGDRVTGSRRAA